MMVVTGDERELVDMVEGEVADAADMVVVGEEVIGR